MPGTTVVRSTHARSTPPTAAMQSTLNSLLTTHDSITTSLSTLRTAASIHATRSSAVADRLAAARGSLDTAKDTGKMVRLKQRFLSELDNAKSLLGGGETALRRVIAILEGVAGATINPSHPALSELAEASTALADALDREWRAWLASSSGAEESPPATHTPRCSAERFRNGRRVVIAFVVVDDDLDDASNNDDDNDDEPSE